MATIDATLQTIAPATASLSTGERTELIDLAKPQVSETIFGDLYELAVANLAAHIYFLSSRGSAAGGSGASGPVTSEKEGQLSRSYGSVGTANAGEGAFSQTAFGSEFLRLRRLVTITPLTRAKKWL